MKKLHILLVENKDDEIEFFTDALEESGLSFLCSNARNMDDALKILHHTTPDIIFVDANMVRHEEINEFKKIKSEQSAPLVFYSAIQTSEIKMQSSAINYVQLPHSINTMAHILKNLFISNEIQREPASHLE